MDAVRQSAVPDSAVDEYMTVPQAARAIGRANATVLQLALRGELRGKIVAGRTVIERASVAEYQAAQEQQQEHAGTRPSSAIG